MGVNQRGNGHTSINKSLSGLLLPSSCEWSTSKVSTVKKCPKTFNLKIVLRQAQLCQKAHIHGNRALGKMSMTNIEHVVGYQVEPVLSSPSPHCMSTCDADVVDDVDEDEES